jgi:hypothetical protein
MEKYSLDIEKSKTELEVYKQMVPEQLKQERIATQQAQ